jgi:DNA-binding MarR family transcriptional regulator
LSRLLLRQLRRATSRIYERAAVSAVGRVHAELLRMARASPGLAISPAPVLSELAVRVLTTRETASRAVSALERRGIVRRESGSLIVVAPQRLEELIV